LNSIDAVTESPRFSARAKWTALTIVVLLSTLIALAAAEGFVRLRQWSKYGTAESYESIYRLDEQIMLRVLVPGARIGNITVNSLGFRGPEIMIPKPRGRIRLAFLGASTTFCAEVSSDLAVWPNLVVDRLRTRFPEVDFDYVNGAVPGYTVQSSRKNLQHRIGKLDPDVVVIYHATNDLSQEVRRLAEAQGLSSAGNNRSSWLAQHLRLWELAEKNLRVIAAKRGAESDHGRVVLDKVRLGNEFRKDLGELVEMAGRENRRVAVATFSTRLRPEQSADEMKQAAVSALVYMPFMSLDGLLFGYARYNEIIRDVTREQKAVLIEGENDIPGDAAHFVDSVHFNDAGSQMMAERVFRSLSSDPGIVDLVRSRKFR
jgi:lysophospholipase L1-like esterase